MADHPKNRLNRDAAIDAAKRFAVVHGRATNDMGHVMLHVEENEWSVCFWQADDEDPFMTIVLVQAETGNCSFFDTL